MAKVVEQLEKISCRKNASGPKNTSGPKNIKIRVAKYIEVAQNTSSQKMQGTQKCKWPKNTNNPKQLLFLFVTCILLSLLSKEVYSVEYSISQGYPAKYPDNFKHFECLLFGK